MFKTISGIFFSLKVLGYFDSEIRKKNCHNSDNKDFEL